ncbi:UbiA family prenyltransferase [Streptacidiphilus anmyonensis]|uniref:UbiA family prenyltransferase n=1 Tax=Streptacidiphilus anmyonensis TaxID=405782 RepID=UPI0005A5E49B|nr:UbiA family prenyltransferase [Streptacidiphilus anmyonensis]
MDSATALDRAAPPVRTPAGVGRAATAPGGWRAYARLAKLDIVDYYLSVPLVAAMLVAFGGASAGRTALVSGLFLLGEVTMVAASVAFDDVTGLRDGSDAANYGPDAAARRLVRKPLLCGVLTERQAIRFGWTSVALCAVLWSAAVVAAPARPLWAVLGTAACAVFGFQYSWGLKLGYRGLQELFLAAVGWGFVLPQFGLLNGGAPGFVVVQALLFGLGPALFGVYSNINDRAADRAVGRLTVAAVVSARGNAVFIGAVSVLEALLILVPAAVGIGPGWFPLAMAPVLVLRCAQWLQGIVRGDVLGARRRGIHVHRLSVALMAASDLLSAVAWR